MSGSVSDNLLESSVPHRGRVPRLQGRRDHPLELSDRESRALPDAPNDSELVVLKRPGASQ